MKTSKSFSQLLRFIDKVSPPEQVLAHCDIPCGVYETDSAMWAVETCEKLVKKLHELQPHAQSGPEYLEYLNSVSRAVAVKEEYAEICKRQLWILWTDYFKTEHLIKWPDLHEKIWKATKQCSMVKRTVSVDACAQLRLMVAEIADIFAASKQPA